MATIHQHERTMMLNLFVPDIGDGLSCGIRTRKGVAIQLDCGSTQDSAGAFDAMRQNNPNYFVLSHFHADHYNGLFEGLKNKHRFPIREVIFPVMPKFQERSTFLYCLMAMSHRVLGGNSSIQYDFLNVMRQLSSDPFVYHPVAKGDHLVLGGIHVEILWPPRELFDDEILKSVRRAIDDFELARKSDKDLDQIYAALSNNEGTPSPYLDEAISEKLTPIEVEQRKSSRGDKVTLPELTKNANKSLQDAANRLSLAFHSDHSLLFMGDLEPNEINNVVTVLEKKSRNTFRIMLTPHHGTHWGKELYNLSVDFAVSSVGSGLHMKIDPDYKKISRKHLITYFVGDIYLPDSFRIMCHPRYWW